MIFFCFFMATIAPGLILLAVYFIALARWRRDDELAIREIEKRWENSEFFKED